MSLVLPRAMHLARKPGGQPAGASDDRCGCPEHPARSVTGISSGSVENVSGFFPQAFTSLEGISVLLPPGKVFPEGGWSLQVGRFQVLKDLSRKLHVEAEERPLGGPHFGFRSYLWPSPILWACFAQTATGSVCGCALSQCQVSALSQASSRGQPVPNMEGGSSPPPGARGGGRRHHFLSPAGPRRGCGKCSLRARLRLPVFCQA